MDVKQIKILLIDNNPKDLKMLFNILTGQGYQVKQATFGQQIINTVLDTAPDLIFLDILVPEIDSYNICQHLKAEKTTQDIPIIAIISTDKLAEKAKYFQLGVVDYITKPLCYEEILVRVQNQLTIQKLQKQASIQLDKHNLQLQQEIHQRLLVESALKASENKYRQLVETFPDIIWSVDVSGRITFVNPAVQQLFGYQPQEMIGYYGVNFILPEQVARTQMMFEQLLNEEPVFRYEATGIAKNGHHLDLMLNAIALRNEAGLIIGAIGTASNITEYKRVEKALQKNTIKLRNYNLALTQLAKNQVLYQGDLKAVFRQITAVAAKNVVVERASIWLYNETATGIQCCDLFEQSCHQHSEGCFLSAADYPTYFQALQQEELIAVDNAHTDSRTQEFSQSYLTPFNITSVLDTPIRLRGKTVGVLCLEAVGVIHAWTLEDENFARSLGNLVSLALEARERQRAEAAHRASEKKLASAFRASPDPIGLLTFPETRYIEVNDSFTQLFGYSRSQVIGRTNRELNIWVNTEECAFLNQILQQTKVIRNHEVDFRTCSGEIKTALFSAEMIEIDGQQYILGTAKDITERKQAENESRLLLLTSQAITRAVDVNSALKVVLRLICQTIGWDFGEAWIPSDEDNVLKHSLVCYADQSSFAEFCHQSQIVQFAPGLGLPGRVWQSKQPEWIEDVSHVMQPTFMRSPQATKLGLKACFGVPILAGREVLAVFVFFKCSLMALDKRLLLLVGTVAAQLGGLIQRKTLERELALREARLNAFFSSAPVYMSILDQQLRFVQINQLLADINGKLPKDHIGKTFHEILPQISPLVTPLYEQVLLTGQSIVNLELSSPVPQQPDIVRHFLATFFPILDESNHPSGVGTVMVEVSKLKRAELALQESQQRYQTLAEASPVGIFHADESANCFYFNRRWCEITGLSQQEALGQGWAKVLHPDDRDRLYMDWNKATAAKSFYRCEHRFLRPDGAVIWVICQALPEISEVGEIKGYIGTITDITERKLAEEALHESAEREIAIAQVIQRMRQTLDLETIFAATTQELRQVLNCDRVVVYRFHPHWSGEFVSESVGNGWISLIEEHKDNPSLTEDMLSDGHCIEKILDHADNQVQDTYLQATQGGVYNQGATFRCVPDIYKADFDPCYINLLERFQAKAYITVPILCGNQLWGLLASYQNSGPRQWKTGEVNIAVQIGNQLGVALQQAQLLAQTQRQSQALQQAVIAADAANLAKSEFLANMSHELRTPLNAILGFTQVMSHDNSLSKEQRENLAIINRAGEHLLNLINDILEMSKIEAGRTTLNLNSFDLIRLIKNLEEMLRLRATSKGLQLAFEYAADLPQYVQTDESKLRQVLLNLLGNAIKFTEIGSVTLRVRVGTRRQGKNNENTFSSPHVPIPPSLIFEVEDTGAGISPQDIDLLFEAFWQTETGKKSHQGTGLGLAISRKYVELMGGDITVSSTLGVGSTFTFDIQINPACESEIPHQQTQRQVIGLAPGQPEYRILVVDDVMESRLVVVKLLSSLGFAVRESANGEEAIAQWMAWQPHLIFMDMRMPVMDGYEATRIIKDHKIKPNSIIIALTANAFEEQRESMLVAGCDDLINKPFREEEILEKISQYLGIEYIYQPEFHPILDSIIPTKKQILTTDELLLLVSQMSDDWVAKVYNAAAQCSDDLILRLLEQIPVENAVLNNYLTDLAHNFQFEQIMEAMSIINHQEC
ncbi:PAS domain S-box protein [Nostocales cyanobacterium LEGE 11386]|nr:PAS domain S-box protein [Nostocales cyanobacterium LEGE 11386]